MSPGGCGLLVDRQLTPGTWVRIRLAGILDGGPRTVRDGRVVYAMPRSLPPSAGETDEAGAGELAPASTASTTSAGSTQSAESAESTGSDLSGALTAEEPAWPPAGQFPWRAGVAFRPVPPSMPGLLATRLLCTGILVLLWTGAGFQPGGIPSGAGVLVPFTVIVVALWVGAELYSRSEQRRYHQAHDAWLSSWAWYDAGSPAPAPPT